MRRSRPSQSRRSPYITSEGAQRLREELKYLWEVKRPEVTHAVAEAAAMGDRSENAEYIYGKKQLREIDRRVRYLSKRLEELKVVDRLPGEQGRVFFGAWVEVEDEAGRRFRYRIVGPDEIDTERGYISIDSPLAQALLRRSEGDEVVAHLPGGEARYVIVAVAYGATER